MIYIPSSFFDYYIEAKMNLCLLLDNTKTMGTLCDYAPAGG